MQSHEQPPRTKYSTNARRTNRLQNLFWVALIVLFGFVLYSLAAVLTPFMFGAILAYILNPGVNWLTRHRCPRWLATLLMIVLLLLVIIVLLLTIVPLLQSEVLQLQQKLPLLLERMNDTLAPKLHGWFGLDIHFSSAALREFIAEHWANQNMATSLFGTLKVGGLAIIGVLGTMVLIPVVLFYLLLDWNRMLVKIEAGIPRRFHAKVVEMVRDMDHLLAQFFRGQLLVMLILAAYYSIALTIAGFESALPVGLITGLLVFIPYIGFSIGLVLAVLAALLQFSGWYGLIAVAVVYGIGQMVESFYLTPRLVGERIGLHPLAVIFALLAFGQIFGFFGVLLALPASAAILVALRHLKIRYLSSSFYDDAEHIRIER